MYISIAKSISLCKPPPAKQSVSVIGQQLEIVVIDYCEIDFPIFADSIFSCCVYLLLNLYLFTADILPSSHLSMLDIYLQIYFWYLYIA